VKGKKVNTRFVIRAQKDIGFCRDAIRFYACEKKQNAIFVAQPLVFKLEGDAEGGYMPRPFLELGMPEGQKLMDELWDCGLRPSEGSGSAGAMRAVEKHLADMKKIAYHALKIK
jgi:hypothetical protein